MITILCDSIIVFVRVFNSTSNAESLNHFELLSAAGNGKYCTVWSPDYRSHTVVMRRKQMATILYYAVGKRFSPKIIIITYNCLKTEQLKPLTAIFFLVTYFLKVSTHCIVINAEYDLNIFLYYRI